MDGAFSEIQVLGSTHPPYTVRTDNASKVRFFATVVGEPQIEVGLV